MPTTEQTNPPAPLAAASALSTQELAFLATIQTGNWCLKDAKASKAIQSLIDRGYCRTEKERLGPLGIFTGEIVITLTEAARISLFPKAIPAAAPAAAT